MRKIEEVWEKLERRKKGVIKRGFGKIKNEKKSRGKRDLRELKQGSNRV